MLEWIISSSALIAVVILLRLILKGKISLRLQYALWALVLARLLLPFSIGNSSFSIMNPVEQSQVYQEMMGPVTNLPSTTVPDLSTGGQTIPTVPNTGTPPVITPGSNPSQGGTGQNTPQPPENPAVPDSDPVKDIYTVQSVDWQAVLRSVWIVGMGLLGAWFFVTNLLFAARVRKNRRMLQTEQTVPVYECTAVDTPCLFGFLRPTVYLTEEVAEDERTMRYAVEHELTHYRHKDHIWAVLRCVCLAVHWYNPLVWWAAILSKNDAELACDESTIRRLGESERAEYGRTLLRLTCEKRPALLNTATTMTGSARTIKERIALIVKKPKMAVYTLIAVVLVAAIAVGCTFTGANDTPDTDDGGQTTENGGGDAGEEDGGEAEEQPNLFVDMEAYVRHRMEQKETVSYYSAATQSQVTVDVLDAKIAWLEKQGEVTGLAPDGVLEAWSYNILVKLDADPEDVMLVGGQYEEDGYFDLEGQGGRITVALRGADGSYDVLYDAVINDGLDFFSYCNTTEEAIHDWYVKKYGLDRPLYVMDWVDCVTVPEGGSLGNIPVHRFDGDGWYIYIPVQAWNCPESAEMPCIFTSAYYTGSTLKVDYFDYSPEGLADDHRKQGFTLIDKANQIWSRSSGGVSTYYYCFAAQDGGCWRVTIEWIDANITDYPYIAMEPDILKLMVESFTVYGSKTVATLPVLGLAREVYDSICTAVMNNLKTGWWQNGVPVTDCTYEAGVFQCVYRESADYTERLYGYAGYFRFDENGNSVEHWYSASIITLSVDTGEVINIWWPGDGADFESDILSHFPEEIGDIVAEPNVERYQAVLAQLEAVARMRMVPVTPSDAEIRLAALTAEDIKHTAGFSEVDAAEIARLIGAATTKRINREEQIRTFWTLELYLSGGPYNFNTGTDEWLSIRTGPEENIVEIIYHSETGEYTFLYCEDEALYQFVRGTYTTEESVDEAAFARFGDILQAKAQETVDRSEEDANEFYPLPYTGYEIIYLKLVETFEKDGAAYEVYEWHVAFLHEDPMKAGLAGGMWIDSELRVRDVEGDAYFVLCTSGDTVAHEFFFWDLYFGPDEETGRENAHDTIVKRFREES